MAALSAGYYFGGVLADRKPEGILALNAILFANGYLIFIALFYKAILDNLIVSDIIWGSILASSFLFGPPMVLLGMMSPFLIRLLAQENTVGSIAGKIFAISTGGSILGTFLTSFVLIPELGSFKTLVALILALAILYISGSLNRGWNLATGGGFIVLALLLPGNKIGAEIAYQTESAYNLIQVKKEKNFYTLALNGGKRAHSSYNKGFVSTGSYFDFMLIGPTLTQSKNLLILGAGAGTSIRQFLKNFPNLQVDAVEIDRKIIAVGEKFFDWPHSPNLKIFVEDARPFLNKASKFYDLIEIDTFAGGPFIPFYLSTKEFFVKVKEKLSPNGWMMMNVITGKKSPLFSDSLGKTVQTVFPNLYILDLGGNLLFFAPKRHIELAELKLILENVAFSHLKNLAGLALERIYKSSPKKNALVFTDDKAPTEKLIYDLVKTGYR